MSQIAMFQMKNRGGINENLSASLRAIETAAGNGAELIFFPEVQLNEFFAQYQGGDASRYAVTIDSEIVRRFRSVCAKNRIIAAPNFFLKENGSYYDANVLIDKNGDILGVQKMVHIAQAENFYEQDYYTPSDDGFKVFNTDIGKIGIVICFDRHYPESIRTEALMGAELILIPTANITSEPLEMFEWEIRVQAFQNSVNIAMCNRVGAEDKVTFAGKSIAVNANGDIIVNADNSERIVYAEVDLQSVSLIRGSRPYTQLLRSDMYY